MAASGEQRRWLVMALSVCNQKISQASRSPCAQAFTCPPNLHLSRIYRLPGLEPSRNTVISVPFSIKKVTPPNCAPASQVVRPADWARSAPGASYQSFEASSGASGGRRGPVGAEGDRCAYSCGGAPAHGVRPATGVSRRCHDSGGELPGSARQGPDPPSPEGRVRAPRLPLIKAAAAHGEGCAEHLNGVVLLHHFDPLVALEGPSQTIPSVFSRISRCWVSSPIWCCCSWMSL
jgi:hypothetical protein